MGSISFAVFSLVPQSLVSLVSPIPSQNISTCYLREDPKLIPMETRRVSYPQPSGSLLTNPTELNATISMCRMISAIQARAPSLFHWFTFHLTFESEIRHRLLWKELIFFHQRLYSVSFYVFLQFLVLIPIIILTSCVTACVPVFTYSLLWTQHCCSVHFQCLRP